MNPTINVAFEKYYQFLRDCALEKSTDIEGSWSGFIGDLRSYIPSQSEDFDHSFRACLRRGWFSQFTAPAFSNLAYSRHILAWYINHLECEGFDLGLEPDNVFESSLMDGSLRYPYKGRAVSLDFLRFLTIVLLLEQSGLEAKTKRVRVLEFGSGYGGLCRVVKLRHRNSCYVVCDMAPSLVFCFFFICANFPGCRIQVVQSPHDELQFEENDFIFVPDHLTDCLINERFDFFVNIYSFGEMNEFKIEKWFDLVQKKCQVDRIFLQNIIFQRVPYNSDEKTLRAGQWLSLIDADWNISIKEINPKITDCPFYAALPSVALIVGERRTDFFNPQEKCY